MKCTIWVVSVALWLVQALAARELVDADPISYLNMADAYLAGNWHALINGYWSPAYPFLLAGWTKVFHTDLFHRAQAVHLLSFVSLVVALISFEYFLRVFLRFRKEFFQTHAEPEKEQLSDDAIWLLGYALFFWATTFLTPPGLEHPDILVFIVYLLVSAVCLQLYSRQEWWRYALLGFLLGLGYLVKSVMFPLGFVFLLAVSLQRFQWRFALRVALGFAVFAVVSLPYVVSLSQSKGRLTYSDVGAVNYRHIMGLDDQSLRPTDMPRPAAAPHIEDFSHIIQLGTYPPWADPSHDFRGEPLRFSWGRQLNRTHVVLRGYFDVYVVQLGALVCGLLILILLDSPSVFTRRFFRQVVLWLPALGGLALYALVRLELRFLPGFTIALFAACVASIRVDDSTNAPRVIRAVVISVSSLLFLQAAVQAGHEGAKLFSHAQQPDWQVATALHQLGVENGDRVSYMGYTLTDHAWAYAAGVRIVSEIPSEDTLHFWASPEAERVAVLHWLQSTGSKALVTRAVPDSARAMGWRQVGDTDYYVLPLPAQQAAP